MNATLMVAALPPASTQTGGTPGGTPSGGMDSSPGGGTGRSGSGTSGTSSGTTPPAPQSGTGKPLAIGLDEPMTFLAVANDGKWRIAA